MISPFNRILHAQELAVDVELGQHIHGVLIPSGYAENMPEGQNYFKYFCVLV